jgi:hypothetical protein
MDPYPVAGGNGDNGWFHHISGWTMKTPKTAFKSEESAINGQSDIDEKAEDSVTTNGKLDKLDRMQFHSVAKGHFAGGMVYEMQIGAYNAICSAHNQYAKDGGLEFKHVDGVDSHAVYSSNATEYPGAPPERLVCAHRHMKNDLFMRVGSTSPIVVNGGMPF